MLLPSRIILLPRLSTSALKLFSTLSKKRIHVLLQSFLAAKQTSNSSLGTKSGFYVSVASAWVQCFLDASFLKKWVLKQVGEGKLTFGTR